MKVLHSHQMNTMAMVLLPNHIGNNLLLFGEILNIILYQFEKIISKQKEREREDQSKRKCC